MTLAAIAPAPGTDAWNALRRTGLGASDIPIIAGVSPYRTPSEFELWELKTGRSEPAEGNERMARGHRLEPVAADWYAEETGRRLVPMGTVRDARWPHLFAHPDRRVVGESRLVEVKTAYREWEDVPLHHRAQVQVQLGLTGLDVCDVALMTFDTLRIYEVLRDDGEIEELLGLGEAWWAKHVLGDVPPLDASPAASRYLNRVSPDGPPMKASADQTALAARIRFLKTEQKRMEDEESRAVETLKKSMYGSSALEGDGWKVSWRPAKGATKTDWKLVAAGFLRPLDDDITAALVALHSKTEEGTRPFRLTFEEG